MKAIFIESGHGRNGVFNRLDTGATSKFGGVQYLERSFTVELGRRVLAILKTKPELKGVLLQGVGIETEATIQKKMYFVNHVITENNYKPSECLGIAIHMNAASVNSARGFEVWCQKNGRSDALGEALVRSWGEYKVTPLRPRAINNNKNGRYGRFYTDDAYCPYVIVETSFISNLEDVNAIIKDYDRAAEAIAHGIMEYVRSLK